MGPVLLLLFQGLEALVTLVLRVTCGLAALVSGWAEGTVITCFFSEKHGGKQLMHL